MSIVVGGFFLLCFFLTVIYSNWIQSHSLLSGFFCNPSMWAPVLGILFKKNINCFASGYPVDWEDGHLGVFAQRGSLGRAGARVLPLHASVHTKTRRCCQTPLFNPLLIREVPELLRCIYFWFVAPSKAALLTTCIAWGVNQVKRVWTSPVCADETESLWEPSLQTRPALLSTSYTAFRFLFRLLTHQFGCLKHVTLLSL